MVDEKKDDVKDTDQAARIRNNLRASKFIDEFITLNPDALNPDGTFKQSVAQQITADPVRFIEEVEGINLTGKIPNEDLLVQREILLDKMEALKKAEGIATGVFQGATAVAGGQLGAGILTGASKALPAAGRLIPGLAAKAPQLSAGVAEAIPKAAGFVGDVVGGSGASIVGEQFLQDPGTEQLIGRTQLEERTDEQKVEDFVNDIYTDVGINLGVGSLRFLGKFLPVVGSKTDLASGGTLRRGPTVRAEEGLIKWIEQTDSDRVLQAALMDPAEFKKLFNGPSFEEAYDRLRKIVFDVAKANPTERNLMGAVLDSYKTHRKAVTTRLNEIIDVDVAEAARLSGRQDELVEPVTDYMHRLSNVSRNPLFDADTARAAEKLFKDEAEKAAKDVLTESTDFSAYQKVDKAIRSLDSRLNIWSDIGEIKSKLIHDTELPAAAKKRLAGQLITAEELQGKLKAAQYTLRQQIDKKRAFGKAAFKNENVRAADNPAVATSKAQAQRAFESATRESLEGTVESLSSTLSTEFTNLNWEFQKLQSIRKSILLGAKEEASVIREAGKPGAKVVLSGQTGGAPAVRTFLGDDGVRRATKTEEIRVFADLFENPKLFRKSVASGTAAILGKLNRNVDDIFRPSNIQAFRELFESPDFSYSEVARDTLFNAVTLMQEGLGKGEDFMRGIAEQLISNPETAPMFKKDTASEASPHLADALVIDGPSGKRVPMQQVPQISDSVSKDKSLGSVKRGLIYGPLHENGSIEGFLAEPTPQPGAPKVVDRKKKADKAVLSLVKKGKKGVRTQIESDRTDELIKTARR